MIMAIDERPATVAFFLEVAAGYTSRPVRVELATLRTEARGIVYGTADAWHILAHDGTPARRLLYTLFHELGHIAAGDVPGDTDADTARNIRAAALGQAGAIPDAIRAAMDRKGQADEFGMERRADEFAAELEARHWPALAHRLKTQYEKHIRGGI